MKHLKTFFALLTLLALSISLVACGTDGNGTVSGSNSTETEANRPSEENPNTSASSDAKVLVVYFSCTNTTKGRAEALQTKLVADIYRIEPAVPYTSADLNYSNNSCRANQEQRDDSCRPEINGRVENMEQYDVIYLGYPIWWGQAPKIMYTFLESYDLSGKTIIPFCTSGGSAMGTSGTNLHSSAPNAVWKSGCLVRSSGDIDALVNMK